MDTYSKWVKAKLYTARIAITAADFLNDRVLPFFKAKISLSRILTDRGTEFYGRHDERPYQLYLAENDIDYTNIKVKSPQTNGICERFLRTGLQEFYQVTFRNKIYRTLELRLYNLDEWLVGYYELRARQGNMCCARTALATL